MRRWSEVFSDMANRNQKKSRYRFYQKFSSLFWRLSRPGKVHQRAAGWYGNDTCWRMVMDLNLIIKYGRADGILADVPQREIWSLCDELSEDKATDLWSRSRYRWGLSVSRIQGA